MYWSLRSSTGVTDEKKNTKGDGERERERESVRERERERDAASIRLSAQAYLIKYAMPFEVVEYSWSREKQG